MVVALSHAALLVYALIMKTRMLLVLLGLGISFSSFGQTNTLTLVTMNCYWFLGHEDSANADRPRTTEEYSLKAGHLIGLLPNEGPLFIGLQEVGNDKDVEALAYSASKRYSRKYVSFFSQGNDSATKQDVGALFDTSRGWGVHGQASRVSELQKNLSKHLVVRLTNAVTHMDIAVVHLRVPQDAKSLEAQKEQNRALLRWSMRHLAQDPKANVVILGDFNEGKPVGTPEQSLSVLFDSRPPLVDAFTFLQGKIRTHAGGGAYDRCILSEGLVKGLSGLKFDSVQILSHSYGKGEQRRLYTDHFPVMVKLVMLNK